MNYIAIGVILLFVIFMAVGFKRGFFKQATSMLISIVPMILSYVLSPIIGGAIVNYSNIEETIYNKIYEKIEITVEETITQELETRAVQLGISADAETIKLTTQEYMKTDFNKSEQVDIINNLPVPSFMRNALIENNNDETKNNLKINGFYDYIARYITYMLMNVITFVTTYIVIMILLIILKATISYAVEIPIVRSIDKIGGLLFGTGQALAIVWVLLLGTVLFTGTEIGAYISSQINGNIILHFLYEKNLLMHMITNFMHIG